MSTLNALANAVPVTVLAAASRSASANGTGIDVSAYEGVGIVIFEAANVSGTSPTCDFKLQESDTSGGTYTDISGAAITQITTVAGVQKIAFEVAAAKKFIRGALALAGTSPVYTCAANFIGVKKYT